MGALLGTATLERGRQGTWRCGSVIVTQGFLGAWWLWKTPEIPWRWLSQTTPFVWGKEQGNATPMCDPAALGSCDIPELFTAPHLELHPPCPSPEFSAQIYRILVPSHQQPVPTTLGLTPGRVGTAWRSLESWCEIQEVHIKPQAVRTLLSKRHSQDLAGSLCFFTFLSATRFIFSFFYFFPSSFSFFFSPLEW